MIFTSGFGYRKHLPGSVGFLKGPACHLLAILGRFDAHYFRTVARQNIKFELPETPAFPVSKFYAAYFGSRKHLAGSLGINSGFARFLPL